MKKEKPRIDKIIIKHLIDENPEISWLGKFQDNLDPGVIVIRDNDFFENLEKDENYELPEKGRDYRFFNPCGGDEKPGTPDYEKYGMQDYERIKQLERGDFCFIGIMAEAVVSYPIENNSRRIQKFTSGGLWGIETDAGDYIKEVEQEQLDDLIRHLKTFGIDTRGYKNKVEIKEF